MSIKLNQEFSNKDLISKLLRIPKRDLLGENIEDIFDHLLKHSDKLNRVVLVKEIAQRYGENPMRKGDSFTQSVQIYNHFRKRLSEAKQESFHIILLDNKNIVISETLISLGILNKSLVHPREVFAPAIEARAASIVIIHNHPSGEVEPSPQDCLVTKRLVDVGELVGIKVLDHLVIGHNQYYSFADNGIMPSAT